MSGYANEPRNLVERAADAALEAADSAIANGGATMLHAIVLLVADDVPDGELDAVTAGAGDELDGSPSALLAALLEHVAKAGAEVGLVVQIHPLAGGPLS